MTPPSYWEELLQGCLNGTLDEAQERELAQILQESSAARQTLRSYLHLEGGLLTLAKAGALDAEPASPSRRLPALRSLTLGLVALAASVMLLVAGLRWFVNTQAVPPSPQVLARVVEVEGSVDVISPTGETRSAAVGQSLLAGDSLRTGDDHSVAVLEFADTTRLELSPETSIRLPEDGTRTVQFIQGVVRGNETGNGERPALLVTTTALKVRVEGDRFVLSSTTPENLRVDMQAGKAEVVRQRDQKSWSVEAGNAVIVQADVEEMTPGPMPRFVTEPKRILDFPGAWAVFFDPDGKHLLAASSRELQRFGPDANVEKTLLSTDKAQGRLAAFSKDGNTLAVYRGLAKEDPVILWDLRTKQQRSRIHARITDQRLILAPDASWVATLDRDETEPVCHVWDGKTGEPRFAIPTDIVTNCLAASPGSKLLAIGVGSKGGRGRNKVLLVDARGGKQVGFLPGLTASPTALAFSPDGRFLAVGLPGVVQIWHVENHKLVKSIGGFERIVTTLTFSPDGTHLAGGTQDGQVWVWDAKRGEEVQVIQAGTSCVRLLAFSPDGLSLVTGGIKRQPLMIWEVTPRPAKT